MLCAYICVCMRVCACECVYVCVVIESFCLCDSTLSGQPPPKDKDKKKPVELKVDLVVKFTVSFCSSFPSEACAAVLKRLPCVYRRSRDASITHHLENAMLLRWA